MNLDGRSHRHGAGLPLRYEWRRRRAFVEVRVQLARAAALTGEFRTALQSLALGFTEPHVASEMERSRPCRDG